jgi:hypothetical protein
MLVHGLHQRYAETLSTILVEDREAAELQISD